MLSKSQHSLGQLLQQLSPAAEGIPVPFPKAFPELSLLPPPEDGGRFEHLGAAGLLLLGNSRHLCCLSKAGGLRDSSKMFGSPHRSSWHSPSLRIGCHRSWAPGQDAAEEDAEPGPGIPKGKTKSFQSAQHFTR